MSALVDVRDLAVEVPAPGGPKLILDRVGFRIERGEALGLVGESGSGKSTTARALLAALPSDATVRGMVRIGEADILSLQADALRSFRFSEIAFIGQNPRATMNPVRRVGDYATEALRTNLGMRSAEAHRRITDLLEEVGIESPATVMGQYPHQLSGGMLQRVVIAAALAADPSLVIADEPTSALDTLSQAEVVGIMNRLRLRRDAAMLFITHDLDLAATVCDRTAVMYAGRIVESQASDRLHRHPQHPYSAGLAAARTRVDLDIPRLRAIPGRPIAAFDRPPGCAFAPRCEFAEAHCREADPELVDTGHGRVACWRHAELAETLVGETTERSHA